MPEGNRRIEIQRRATSPGPPWVTYAQPWARVTMPTGREFFTDANLVQGQARAVFRFRFIAGIEVTDRLKWDGRTWDIQSVVDEDGAHRWTVLHSVEHPR